MFGDPRRSQLFPRRCTTDYEYADACRTPVHHTWWMWLGHVFRSRAVTFPPPGVGPDALGTPGYRR